MSRNALFAAACLVSLCVAGNSAVAATISAGIQDPVANGGMAPGSALNFDFGDFGNGGQPIHLANFTVSTSGDSQYPGNGSYTSVIAPNGVGPFTTGIAYDGSFTAHTGLIATFSPTVAGNFSVWILDGNTDGSGVGNASVGLGVNSGTAVTTATVYSGINEFTRYDVTGALKTDVFQVYATTTIANSPSIGGLTFTPEPASFVLSGLGAIGLLFAVRRRRRSRIA